MNLRILSWLAGIFFLLATIPGAIAQKTTSIHELLSAPDTILENSSALMFVSYEAKPSRKEKPAWKKGILLDLNNQIVEVQAAFIPLTKNIYLNQEGTVRKVQPLSVRAIQIDNQIMVPAVFESTDGRKQEGFFELLQDGRVQLLFNAPSGFFKFFQKGRFYLYRTQQTALPIKGGKSDLLNFLQDQRVNLETYIKKQSLNVNKKDDLTKLLKYYNEL
jgi:hypothetical protein